MEIILNHPHNEFGAAIRFSRKEALALLGRVDVSHEAAEDEHDYVLNQLKLALARKILTDLDNFADKTQNEFENQLEAVRSQMQPNPAVAFAERTPAPELKSSEEVEAKIIEVDFKAAEEHEETEAEREIRLAKVHQGVDSQLNIEDFK